MSRHAAAPRRRANSRLLVAVLSVTGTVVALQQTLVVPLLPEVPRLLHTTADNASWLVTATLLTAAVATPIVSKLADMVGKRRMMFVCLVMQLIGSVVAALGDTLGLVITGRALQGFAAALIPVGISIMRDELPRERVGSAVALMSATLGIGAAIGLPLSGFIYDHASWHALFWVSAVMAATMFVLILLVVPESTVRSPGRFDLVGALVLSAALTFFLLAVTKGGSWGWVSERTVGLFLAAAVLTALWLPYELRSGHPMVDLRTAARRPVLLTNIASVVIGFSMYGNMLSTTELLQMPKATGYGFGLGIQSAGLAMLPAGLAMVLLAPVSAGITRRFGGRMTLIVGALVLALGYVTRVFLITDLWQIVASATIVSAGTAIAYAAMPTLIMANVPITETASANGLNTLLRAIGTSTSSAAVAALLTSETMHIGPFVLPTLDAFKYIFWLCAIAALIGALVAGFLPAGRPELRPTAPAPGPGAPAEPEPDEIVVHGVVHSGDGGTVKGAVVTMLTMAGRPVDWSRADADGVWSLVLPGPGRYLRVTNADRWAPRSEVVVVDETHRDVIDLGDRLQLVGTVVSGDIPVQGVLVTLLTAGGELAASSTTGPDGSFALPLSTHGRHVITAVDPTTYATASAHLTLVGVERRIDLDLHSGAAVPT